MQQVVAWCARQFEASTRRAAGVDPVACPPGSIEMPAHPPDLLYLALHGLPGDGVLYGDYGWPAVHVADVRRADWSGTTVFAQTCHFPQTPFPAAFLQAGARAVIAGSGENYSPARGLAGASLLGLWVRRGLALGWSPARALALAKMRVRLQLGQRAAARDALQFVSITR